MSIETGTIEYRCDLCGPSWTGRTVEDVKEHQALMNRGKPRDSQWYHEIKPVMVKA